MRKQSKKKRNNQPDKKKSPVFLPGEKIRVCDVEKYYGTKNNITKAVNRVSFTVEHGEFVGIMGASGSGASVKIRLS
mgnify:CR=1 FL=1